MAKKKAQDQLIIANMGLFWKRDHVRWRGNRKVGPSRLAGKRATGKRKGEVDFWSQTGVYALYANYSLVYVGQAGLTDKSCIGSRLKHHIKDDLAGRWDMFSWFGLRKVTNQNKLRQRGSVQILKRSVLANVLEGIVIAIAEPPMNSQKGRFGPRVVHFVQVDDSKDLEAETQDKILKSIAALSTRVKTTKKQILKKLQATKKK